MNDERATQEGASEGDALEQSRTWKSEKGKHNPSRLPPDVPEGDAIEQSQPWAQDDVPERPVIPPDAPEPDALEQSRPVDVDDEERRG